MGENITKLMNDKSGEKIFVSLLILGATLLIFSGISFAANTIYVNASGGNDNNDGSSWIFAKKSIKNATESVDTNGIVYLSDGTYTGAKNRGIEIKRNMKILGQSQTGTVIDAQYRDRIFTINSGVSLILNKLTLKCGKCNDGGAVSNDGILTVNDSTFYANKAYYVGGAITNGGNLTVTNSQFIDNSVKGYNGGAIYNFGNLEVTDSTFTGNTANWNGGAITNWNGTINITGSNFTGNTAYKGGALYIRDGNSSVHFCQIRDNSATEGSAIYCDVGYIDAVNNWWGSNINPKHLCNLIAGKGSLDVDPWIILPTTDVA